MVHCLGNSRSWSSLGLLRACWSGLDAVTDGGGLGLLVELLEGLETSLEGLLGLW